jgi:hypothetical protein
MFQSWPHVSQRQYVEESALATVAATCDDPQYGQAVGLESVGGCVFGLKESILRKAGREAT